jgi:RNA polymerase sigma-70 factor (ECF subfamily)
MTEAMERLNPKARNLLWLAYVEALSHREMAKILSLREGSIRVLLFRARKALEKELRREP